MIVPVATAGGWVLGVTSLAIALLIWLRFELMVRRWTKRASSLLEQLEPLLAKGKAALAVDGPDGKPLPPLQAAVSVGASCLVNAAYTLLEDPAIVAKAKPLIMEALPQIAEAYGRGQASGDGSVSSAASQMSKARWADRGGALKAVGKVAGTIPGGSKMMGKVQDMLQLAQAAKELAPLIQQFTAGKGGGNGGSAPMVGGGGSSAPMQGGSPW